ncbi:uncharacterized protein BKA55DRAFT_269195 [Fusarium redolens]|uniref:Uncharacterized protein n=1 Tax=Fusarium redolens TaxID=48865 RepID=A0A9P9HND7_FUSRE|nr:uncharacterized protein BKA55DRAFT_269195 [Fusarium redolens]KAH7260725.1 hypothetical protein BKA55DRAFT_269195 [Fusarium redolens]
MPAEKPYLLISWPQPSSYNPPERLRQYHASIIHHAVSHPTRLLTATANSITAAPSRCLSEEACSHPMRPFVPKCLT